MVILITGATHTGKTTLAQRMLERYGYPYLSMDHLKIAWQKVLENNNKQKLLISLKDLLVFCKVKCKLNLHLDSFLLLLIIFLYFFLLYFLQYQQMLDLNSIM